MPIPDDRLIAYADGELDEAARAEIEAAIAADPSLAHRLERHRALRARVGGAFAGALSELVPEAWKAIAARPAVVVDLGQERARRRRAAGTAGGWRAGWRTGLIMAACLAAGLFVGRIVLPAAGPPMGENAGALVAKGPLDKALSEQLASAPAAGPTRIGVSFRSRDDHLCRTFQTTQAGGLAGLACREGDRWRVRVAVATPAASRAQYQPAGSQAPAAVLSAMDEMIVGEPLDARAEAAAKARHWRP